MTQSKMKKTIPAHYANKGNLLEGSITKHLMRLTIPMVWGIGIIISFQLVDIYFISRLGKESLAAVSFTFPVTYAIFVVSMGFSIAMSSVISRLIGEGDKESVNRVTTQGLLLTLICSVVLSLLAYIFQKPIFQLMGADETLLPITLSYMSIWLLSMPFLSLPMVGNSSIRAGGDAMTPAIIMTASALTNLILDPLLIFGLAGFPELGVEGAAWATLIANVVAMVAGLYVLVFVKKRAHIKWLADLSDFKDTTKRLLVIALPVGITSLILPITNAVIIGLLSSISVEAVASFGIATRVEAFAFIVLMALSTAMAPIIGQNWGAGDFNRVYETLKKSIKFNVLWSLAIAVVLVLLGKQIAGLFSDDPAIIELTQMFFWIVPLSYALSNLANGWMSAFNAMGKPKRSLVMMLVKYIVMLLPALWVGQLYGIVGIFSAIAFVNILSGLGFHILSWRACKACETQ
ncbi:MAG: MATE family efflux transporter [Alphaproteobacteria bacterium]|nr:MATE family efflux transporter [Alphaproteobacteria bacterium]